MNPQSIWQRAATGVVAAAACAVFVGGGAFIVKQAMEQKQNNNNNPAIHNFLGGTGEIHVADRNLQLMYDDTKIYYSRGYYSADRSQGQFKDAAVNLNAISDAVNFAMWDGERFYKASGSALYRMDMTGNSEDTPFFTVTGSEDELPEGSEVWFRNIDKISEDSYVITYEVYSRPAGEWDEETGVMDCVDYAVLYAPESGKTVKLPENSQPDFKALDDHRFVGQRLWNLMGSDYHFYIYDINDDSVNELKSNSHGYLWGSGWFLQNGSVYYQSYNSAGYERESKDDYGKMDLETGNYTRITNDLSFDSFFAYDGRCYAATKDGKQFISFDPEMTDVQIIYDFDASAPQELKDLYASTADARSPYLSLTTVDANYALLEMNPCGSQRIALYDFNTGEMQYIACRSDEISEQDSQEDSDTAGDTNFLGGTGEIHIGSESFSSLSYNLNLMYDESNVYFSYANFVAKRYGSGIDTATERKPLPNTLCDGENFFTCEDRCLYSIDRNGAHTSRFPFFMVDEKALDFKEEICDVRFFRVVKLTDEYYYIGFVAAGFPNESGKQNTETYYYLYKADILKQIRIPDTAIIHDDILADGTHLDSMDDVLTDGTYLYAMASENSICKIALESGETEICKLPDRMHRVLQRNWALANGCIYFMAEKDANPGIVSYGKYDLKTQTYTEILAEPDFVDFIPYDGMIYALTKSRDQIICADPEWTKTLIVYDFYSAAPQEIVDSLDGVSPHHSLYAMDENYFLLDLSSAPDSLDVRMALINRINGENHWYTFIFGSTTGTSDAEKQAPEKDQKTESKAAQITEDTAYTNDSAEYLFGGKGRLRPVDWNAYGQTNLFRDDESYYALGENGWMRFPLSGGKGEYLPDRINGAQAYTGRLFSDGEQVYDERLQVVSGNPDIPFRFNYEQNMTPINPETGGNSLDRYEIYMRGIWHIQDHYFILASYVDYGLPSGNNDYDRGYIRIWTDNSGEMESYEIIGDYETQYFCDENSEHLYRLKENGDVYQVFPDEDWELVKDVPDDAGIYNAQIDRNGTLYYATKEKLIRVGTDGSRKSFDDVYTMSEQDIFFSPDGRQVFFTNVIDGVIGICVLEGDEVRTVWQGDDFSRLLICGFEQTPDGRTNLIVYDLGDLHYRFIDTETFEVKTVLER